MLERGHGASWRVRREPTGWGSELLAVAWSDDDGWSTTWVTGLPLPTRRANSLVLSAEGQRPRGLAYEIVPPFHTSATSRRTATQSQEAFALRIRLARCLRRKHASGHPTGTKPSRMPPVDKIPRNSSYTWTLSGVWKS
jgi:hypothetical protein